MLIILEGPDGSGKSTLGQMLSDRLGYQLVHSGKPKYDELVPKSLELAALKDTIIDRVPWISEFVYSKVFDRQAPPAELTTIGRSIKDTTIIVRCDTEALNPLIKDNEYKDKAFSLAIRERTKTIRSTYDRVFNTFEDHAGSYYTSYNIINYDYTKDSPEDVLEMIQTYMTYPLTANTRG